VVGIVVGIVAEEDSQVEGHRTESQYLAGPVAGLVVEFEVEAELVIES